MLAAILVGLQVWLAVGATIQSISQPEKRSLTETSRQYENPPQTPVMIGASPLVNKPLSESGQTQKVFKILTFSWQFMPSANLKEASRSKIFLDTAFFLRNLGICLIVLKLISSAHAQLITATCLQLLYLCYFVYCNIYQEKLEFVVTFILEVFMFVALLLKTLSTIPSISESNLQNTLGLLLLIMLAVSILLTTGSIGIALVWNWRTEKNTSSETQSFQPCTLTAAQQNAYRSGSSSAGHKHTSNLKIIVDNNPTNHPEEAAFGDEISMKSVPHERLNHQTPAHSFSVTEQQHV